MKRVLYTASAALLMAAGGNAGACRVAPASQLMDADRQVGQARNVVLARVIGVTPADPGETLVAFALVRRLAGSPSDAFAVPGEVRPDDRTDARTAHADPAFWARGGGRAMSSTDCKIHPTFVMGGTYLMFRDEPVTRRSFERIATDLAGQPDPTDKWLTYVQSELAQMTPQP